MNNIKKKILIKFDVLQVLILVLIGQMYRLQVKLEPDLVVFHKNFHHTKNWYKVVKYDWIV
jgi:hypothetical protein